MQTRATNLTVPERQPLLMAIRPPMRLAEDLEELSFVAAEVNETLIRGLATGHFLDYERNLVLIGGTGASTDISLSASPAHASGFQRR